MVSSPSIVQVNPNQPPPLGQAGLSALDKAIQYGDAVIEVPDIKPEDLNKMMRADGEIGSLYRILTTPVRGASIEIEPAHGRGGREAEFIERVLFNAYPEGGMRIPFKTVVATIMRMIINGWSPHEIVWDIRDGYVRVDKIEYRPVHTIQPVLDENRNLIAYDQDVSRLDPNFYRRRRDTESTTGKVRIAPEKVLHFVNGPEWNYIFGRSIFTHAYYHFEKKHKLYYISHIAAQINALRLRLVEIPDQYKSIEQEILDKVGKLGFNTTISVPEGVVVHILETGNNYTDLLPLIQHHDAQMAKSVLAQVVDVGVEGRTGSFNLSDTHFDIFIENLGLMAEYIADVINTVLIPKLIEWNFGTNAYPKIKFSPFDRQVKKQLFELFNRIATAPALNVTPNFLLDVEQSIAETLNMDVDYQDREAMKEVFMEKVRADPPASQGGPDNRARSRTDR